MASKVQNNAERLVDIRCFIRLEHKYDAREKNVDFSQNRATDKGIQYTLIRQKHSSRGRWEVYEVMIHKIFSPPKDLHAYQPMIVKLYIC